MKNNISDASKKALIVVDVQNDFCPGGALAVSHGDEVIEPLNRLIEMFIARGGHVIPSRDWHPQQSRHFAEFGGQWPVHCVQNTKGAEFHPGLRLPTDAIIISKGLFFEGTSEEVDGYSAFGGMATDCRTLETILHTEGIRRVIVGGLATDYCVKETVLDALRLDFAVDVALYACRHVAEDTRDKAIAEMYHRGACIHNAPFISRGR